MITQVADIFCEMCDAFDKSIRMQPRSASDKEYFAQDWFIDRLESLRLPYVQQGRNSYPDFWVGHAADREGYEIKSLAFVNGQPARTDIDFNSTIPSGLKEGSPIFRVFFLYTGRRDEKRTVHSISVAHLDLINADHALADEHINVAIHDFGAFADGFIRNRKMYVFPHPISLDPEGLGRKRLIVPSSWRISDPRLQKVETVKRVVAAKTIDRYAIRLRGRGQAEVEKVQAENAGKKLRFSVFERAAN